MKVVAPPPRRTRQTTGKMPASLAAAMIAATQAVELKKKRKRTDPVVSVDTTITNSDVETINIEEEDGMKSASTSADQAAQMPRKVVREEECSGSGADVMGDMGLQKRVMKEPPKPIKLMLKSIGK